MAFDPDIVDVAIVAHRLWCKQMLKDGWRYAPAFSEARREHDALVPFEQLSAHDQRMACRAVQTEELAQRLADAVEHARGPDREFSPDEMRAGLPVVWADWAKPELNSAVRGEVLSWALDSSTGEVESIRVRWSDGTVSEHVPAERELQRLS